MSGRLRSSGGKAVLLVLAIPLSPGGCVGGKSDVTVHKDISCDLFEPFPVPADEIWQSWPEEIKVWVDTHNRIGEKLCGWLPPNPEPDT